MAEQGSREVGSNKAAGGGAVPTWAGKKPPTRMQQFMWSGSKKHVFFGLLAISAVATIPWILLTSGSQHQSHADYMDRAEKARQERLSTSASSSTTVS
ncbi:hypothetical protein O6H91_21G007200 [Diphasiastrum complanatum]|uniref:Uncharacterized protein n=1 Tax=Diphasiastrum complanatum TaxID=34168 RepID=A0ACC2AHD6_DIPCM|nr:hypothetical protein O6H91_21G007200 [Diphasiastrum complanatum]